MLYKERLRSLLATPKIITELLPRKWKAYKEKYVTCNQGQQRLINNYFSNNYALCRKKCTFAGSYTLCSNMKFETNE